MEKGEKISCQFPTIRETMVNRNKSSLFQRKNIHTLFISKLNYFKEKLMNKEVVVYFLKNTKEIQFIQLQI